MSRFMVDELRRTSSEDFIEKLKAAAKEGEPWAVTLGLHYCLGKPTDMQMDLSSVTDEELRAEVERRHQLERDAKTTQPAEASPEPH